MISTSVRRLSRSILPAGVSLLSLMLATPAWAGPDGPTATTLPTGGEVVAGQATIGTNGSAMTVTQGTRRGIINWQGFDIGSDASVQFVQPDANSVTLNRVLGGNGSTIAGKLSANGKVYVTNPNGVLFTSTAQVDVGGLVAAAGDIANADFLAGRDVFSVSATGSVINQGRITARDGGAVVLVGGTVSNPGAISATRGDVVLAAGSKVTLDAGADGHLKVEVDDATGRALVQNGGLIAAGGGRVLLTAQGAGAAVSSVVSNTGMIEARTLSNQSGKILLLAGMDSGMVQAGGTLDASAPDGGDGGFIETSAASVAFAPDLHVSTLASSGKTGTWLIDPYNITISSAPSSTVIIDSLGNPWLVGSLGPGANLNNATLSGYLASNNVTVRTASGGTEPGNVTVSDAVNWNAATTLTLQADGVTGGIFLNAAINGSNANSSLVLNAGSGGINQNASGAITIGTLTAMAVNGGGVALNVANNQIQRLGASASAGNFSIGNGTALTVTGPVSSGTGKVSIVTAGDLTINAAMSSGADDAIYRFQSSGGALRISRDVTLSGNNPYLILTSASGYTLTNGARLTLSGASADLTINSDTYTVIQSLAQLQALGTTGYYALGVDIDASATAGWNSGAGFAPIGGLGMAFTGTFAGLGHAIDGLTINRAASNGVGLFGASDNGIFRDFTLSNLSVTGGARTGAVVGDAYNTSFDNIHVTGSVRGYQQVGGIAGWFGDSSISGTSSTASVSASQDAAGGLAGYAYFINSITNSYAVGPVTGATDVGGLIGRVDVGSTLALNAVYASGRLTGGANVGGLVGLVGAGTGISGGNAYWDVNSTGSVSSPTGTGITSANAFTQGTYAGFDFTNTWTMLPGDTRPMLRNEASSVIFTTHALQLMSQDVTSGYTLGTNLDFGTAFTTPGDVWNTGGFVPIGNPGTPFSGAFNGQNHSITGLTINRGSASYVGLFGYVNGGVIRNVQLTGGSVTGRDFVGGLAGFMFNANVTNASASTAVTGTFNSQAKTGGLIGAATNSNITLSSASGNVTGAGAYVGGLIGLLQNGSITQSYATGSVTGTSTASDFGYIGGLVGANGTDFGNNGGSISQSYATGAVRGASGPIGGLVGRNEGAITDSYATGSVTGTSAAAINIGGFVGFNSNDGTISRAYSTGYVSGSTQQGGFIGHNNASSGTITNAYWDVQTSGRSQAIYSGTATGISGTTSAQLQGALPAGFTSAVWGTGAGLYPYLGWRYSTAPVAVSGIVTNGFGGAALAGATVTGVSNGVWFGSSGSGANGYYYILSDAAAIGASGVLTYIDNAAIKGAAFSDVSGASGKQNLDIYGLAVNLRTDNVSLTSTLADYVATRGSHADSDLAFLSASSLTPLTTSGNGVYLSATGAYALDSSLTSGGALTINAGGTLGVSGTVGMTANGAALTINAPVSWTNASELVLSATSGGSITLGGAVNATNGSLSIAGSSTVDTAHAVNVKTFVLASGNWSQIGTLPGFSATNFQVTSTARFVRALGGDGSLAAPYQITDIYGLQGMASNPLLDSNLVLANDIDASGTAGWNSGAGFRPIGNAGNAFTGSLDGQGHIISGLTINRAGTDFVGLFGYMEPSGSVSNVTLNAFSVTGRASVGGLVGRNQGQVTNSAANGAVQGTGDVGVLVGYNLNGGTISRSSSSGSVIGGGFTGGLVGANQSSLIDQSYSTATVSGTGYIGGLAGGNVLGTVQNSYATGSVSGMPGALNAGGLFGLLQQGTVTNSYASGAVTSTAGSTGGLVGRNDAGTITASFWNTASSGLAVGVGNGASTGATGVSATGMNLLATFAAAGWDIDAAGGTGRIWRIYEGSTAPLLRAFLTPLTVTGGNATTTYSGSATSGAGTLAYSIGTPDLTELFGTAGYVASSANAGSYSSASLTMNGLYSNQLGYDITATPGSLTINPATLIVRANGLTKTYDGLGYSGGNGVSYTGFVNNEDASVLGGMLAYGGAAQGAVDAGNYAIIASGLTSNNYSITYVSGTLLVNPAALTVTVNDAIKTYNGLGYAGGGGVSYNGFVNGDGASVLGGSLVYGGTSQGAVNVGSYGLTASGLSSGNYTISYVGGGLTINPAPLTVTVNSATKTYDGLAYSGGNGVSYNGLVNGESASVLGGSLVYGGAAQGAINAGTYGITASGLTSGNYAISYVAGALVVDPAALTVTVNGATKTYDGLAYAGGNGVSYGGFVNGEGASVLGGSLVYGGSAQGAVNAGSYGLTASGLTSGNYAISYVGGSLVVNPAALTVTVNGATKTYDGLAYAGGNGVSYDGFVNGEGASVLGGSLAYGGAAQGAVNAGTYGLTASGLTSGNYAISYVGGSLVVNPAALTVTVNGATKTYDGLAYAGGNGVSYGGFVNGEGASVLGGSLVYGGSSQGAVNAGSYGLTASGLTSGNYAISYVGGSLVVNPAALTVTVNGATKTYDGLAYAGGNGVSYVGFVNGEVASVLGGALAYGGAAQGAVNAGTYGLTASGLTSGNYAISYVAGSLVVNPAALTVAVNGATKTYDGLAYAGGNGVSYGGFVNGEGASVLGGALVYGGAAQGAINVGSYGLNASGLSSGNYTIRYVAGNLVITPAALTVRADSLSAQVFGAFPVLTYTVSGLAQRDALADVLRGALASDATLDRPGDYAITQGSLVVANPNYVLAGFVPGTLTVSGAEMLGSPDGGFFRSLLLGQLGQGVAGTDAVRPTGNGPASMAPAASGGPIKFEPDFIR